ncbi:MAG: GGDEF domain-containing protein [Pseudomonadota bacterium]
MRRFFISVGSYSLWFLATLAATGLGLLELSGSSLVLAGVLLVASQLVFYAAFRTGFNLKFSEPSLTLPQMVVGIVWGLVLVAVAPQIRGYVLMAVIVTLLFGIFALKRQRFVQLAALAFLGYLGVVAFEIVTGSSSYSPAYHAISVGTFAVVVVWTTLFGAYVSAIRHRLSVRNEELEVALAHNQRLAERDDLTGLYNRRFLTDVLVRERARADRNGQPLSIAIIDLDRFKQINDRYGHSTGDRVLRNFADYIVSELRTMDYVGHAEEGRDPDSAFGRYGGEEFMLVLPETGLDDAHRCLDRLRSGLDRMTADPQAPPHVTLSAGIAQFASGESVESLLRRADQALYDAKDGGRNRICLAA